MPSSRLVLGGLAAVALLLAACTAQMHTRVEVIDDTCDAQLGYLWGNYTNPPVAPVAGCDRDCLAACRVTLDWAIYSEKQQNCPLQTDIIRCFHVYRAPWIMFVNKCALFQYGTSGNAEAEGEGSTPSSSAPAAEGEATAAEGEATAAEEETAAAEGVAAEGVAAEGEAGRRRVLLQEAEAALGAGEINVYNGCFPNFATADDFVAYIDGEYKFTYYSSAVGITLSVLFFTSLLLVGTGLPKFVKAPFKKFFGLLNCFKRRQPGPTKLEAPATVAIAPAEITVDDSAEAAKAS